MKLFAFLLISTALVACSPAAAADSQATMMAMAVELTLQANAELTAEVTPTETATETPAETEVASPTPQPSPTELPAATHTPTATALVIPDWPLFRNGDSGPEVFAIQHLLRSHGHDVTVDGLFGPQTRQRVIAFQNGAGLGTDGIVGPQTWAALIQGRTVDQGDTGQAVRALQRLLSGKFGYNQVNVDGQFGPLTRAAVDDFQAKNGLTVDGIVGPQTWQALVAMEP
ncbi:MAG: peptidoglycan-binding protein [Anaerolineales bacterium]|nr:peptidoglycan-binding protein [Anaerolineales bacterium]